MRALFLCLVLASSLRAGPIGLRDIRSINDGYISAYTADHGAFSHVSAGPQEAPVRLGLRMDETVSGRLRVNGLSASVKTQVPADLVNPDAARFGGVRSLGESSTRFHPEYGRLRVILDFDVHGGEVSAELYDLNAPPGTARLASFGPGSQAKSRQSWKFDVDPTHEYELAILVRTDEYYWDESTDTRVRAELRSYIKSVPEPGSLVLLGLGLGAFGILRRRRGARLQERQE